MPMCNPLMVYKRKSKKPIKSRRITRFWRIGSKRKSTRVDRVQNKRLKRLERQIETKEGSYRCLNKDLPHNNVYVVVDQSTGSAWNPFHRNVGTTDPMNGPLQMVGDKITVKGLLLKGFFENSLGRAKVHYRVMLIRCAKGDTIDRINLFKADTDNKMLDQVNTERYTIISQKYFNIEASNAAPLTVGLTGVPATGTPAGNASKIWKMWIPGRKFGPGGNITYENQSQAQIKFYDYRLVVLAYDWYGTPQDANNVGKINEILFKTYFQDV